MNFVLLSVNYIDIVVLLLKLFTCPYVVSGAPLICVSVAIIYIDNRYIIACYMSVSIFITLLHVIYVYFNFRLDTVFLGENSLAMYVAFVLNI